MPFPAPLEEAITEEVYNAYVLTPPGTPVPAEVVDQLSAREEEGADGSRGTAHSDLARGLCNVCRVKY